MNIVLVTGGFDPLHTGHLRYFESARALGDRLIVGVNSDQWLQRKKNRAFMPWSERSSVVASLRTVDEVLDFDDSDDSACAAILTLLQRYPNDTIIFANGGDRTADNIPEQQIKSPRLRFEFGVGGTEKINSSSWILDEWRAPRTERPWGYYRVMHAPNPQILVKELTVDPGKSLSMQRHHHRSEFWMVTEGRALVYTLDLNQTEELYMTLDQHQHCWIDRLQWHRLCNVGNEPLRLIEIQWGDACQESDIQRF